MTSHDRPDDALTPEEQETISHVLVRLNEHGWGIAFGLLAGLGLFAATIILVIRGGAVVGPRLALLGVYLPGYDVTTAGAFIGLGYGVAIGYLVGFLIGALYNRLVTVR